MESISKDQLETTKIKKIIDFPAVRKLIFFRLKFLCRKYFKKCSGYAFDSFERFAINSDYLAKF